VPQFTESIVEQAALAWLESLGWSVRDGLEIARGEPEAERTDDAQAVLEARRTPNLLPRARTTGLRNLRIYADCV